MTVRPCHMYMCAAGQTDFQSVAMPWFTSQANNAPSMPPRVYPRNPDQQKSPPPPPMPTGSRNNLSVMRTNYRAYFPPLNFSCISNRSRRSVRSRSNKIPCSNASPASSRSISTNRSRSASVSSGGWAGSSCPHWGQHLAGAGIGLATFGRRRWDGTPACCNRGRQWVCHGQKASQECVHNLCISIAGSRTFYDSPMVVVVGCWIPKSFDCGIGFGIMILAYPATPIFQAMFLE